MSGLGNHRASNPRSPAWGLAIDYTITASVIAMIAFAAAAFGAVEPWSEAAVTVAALCVWGLGAASLTRDEAGRRRSIPMIILAAFCAFIALQATPLPAGVVGAISPSRVERTARLLSVAPEWLSLSYYPRATMQGLRLVMIGVAVFVATAAACRQRQCVIILLTGLFGIGVAEATLSLAQIASGAEGVYWIGPVVNELRSGSFVNHSNFSQFLNLTAGAGVGLLMIRLSEERRENRTREGRTQADRVLRAHGWLILGLALHGVAITASLSRAGCLATVVAMIAVGVMAGRQRRLGRRAWMLLFTAPLAFAGVILIGFDAVYERIATLENQSSYADRVELTLATLRLAGDHPVAGVGLNAYGQVFPAYDTTGSIAVAGHADNDYAQLLAEMGLIGSLLVVSFLFAVARRIRRGLSRRRGSIRYALCGVAFGLVAVAVQSLTDFGQRVPAVFCVSAALCGVAWAVGSPQREASGKKMARSWLGPAAMLLIAIPLGAWATREAILDVRAHRWWSVAYGLEQRALAAGGDADPQLLVDLVAAAETASALRPGDAEYAYWLNVYRWRLVRAASGADERAIAASSEGRDVARKVADALRGARVVCPTYGAAYTLEGRLRLVAGEEDGARLVKLGADLAPNNPVALITAAEVEAEQGDEERSVELLRRAVRLDQTFYTTAASIGVEKLNRPDLAKELAGRDPALLTRFAVLLEALPSRRSLAQEFRAEAAALREARVLSGEATANEIAASAARRAAGGEHDKAVELYRRALAKRFDNVPWRLALVDVLVKQERYELAEREARIALRIHPGHAGARKRLEAISLLVPPP